VPYCIPAKSEFQAAEAIRKVAHLYPGVRPYASRRRMSATSVIPMIPVRSVRSGGLTSSVAPSMPSRVCVSSSGLAQWDTTGRRTRRSASMPLQGSVTSKIANPWRPQSGLPPSTPTADAAVAGYSSTRVRAPVDGAAKTASSPSRDQLPAPTNLKLMFVRHAQSQNNKKSSVEGREAGRDSDPSITAEGEAQAALLARYLKAARDDPYRPLKIDSIVTSPMLRCLQTTAPICEALGLPAHVFGDIHEQGGVFHGHRGECGAGTGDHPHIHGMTASEIQERFPFVDGFTGVDENGWWPGGYEPIVQTSIRARRVVEALKDMAEPGKSKTVLVVTHGWFLELLIKAFLGLPLPWDPTELGPNYILLHNTSVTSLDLLAPRGARTEWAVALTECNAMPHLVGHSDLILGQAKQMVKTPRI